MDDKTKSVVRCIASLREFERAVWEHNNAPHIVGNLVFVRRRRTAPNGDERILSEKHIQDTIPCRDDDDNKNESCVQPSVSLWRYVTYIRNQLLWDIVLKTHQLVPMNPFYQHPPIVN